MFQIWRCFTDENDENDWSRIGPMFKTPKSVVNYINSTIPKSEHWELFIAEGEPDEDGDIEDFEEISYEERSNEKA